MLDLPMHRQGDYNPWQAWEDAIIDAGIKAGKSAKEIADELPLRTRNAVCGRAHRRKLALDPDKSKKSRGLAQNQRAPRIAIPRKREEIICEPLLGVGVPFIEAIQTKGCTWFLAGQAGHKGHVCGNPRSNGSYCSTHHTLAYRSAA